MDASVFECLNQLSGLQSIRHARVQRRAKQMLSNSQKNIAEKHLELVLPVLKEISLGKKREEEETALLKSITLELTLSEPKVLAMLGSSDRNLRKAVAKAAVLLWYSRFNVRQLSVRTYLRKGKEKTVVSWTYTNESGVTKEGFLFVFSCFEDLESNFGILKMKS